MSFGREFIPRSVGVTEADDFVQSNDPDYIKRRIRELYLADSTVTILLLGACTWSRKFVDWELSSSLRNDTVNRRNGLLAMPLPSTGGKVRLPDRLRDNWDPNHPDDSFASFVDYPSSGLLLRTHIESAYKARNRKAVLINNHRALKLRNTACR